MSDDKNDDKENEIPLTPEQRLDIIESKVSKNRIVLWSVALFLVIMISASVTALMIFSFSGQTAPASEGGDDTAPTLEGQAELLEQYDIRLAELSSKLKVYDIKIQNNANSTIQKILIEQEQAKQAFMETVRASIYDLAHMVPGSRSWLELYSEQLDTATAKSQQRIQQLQLLNSTEPVGENDPFFGEEF
jgi:flagellar basal body-associated protein FliL